MFEDRPDIQRRLAEEVVLWLTTVSPDGQAQSSPVWFLAEPDGFVIYSLSGTPRVRNIGHNPRVCLNLNSSRSGGEIVIVEGRASIASDGPRADHDPDYLAKYEGRIAEEGWTPEQFARDYPVRIYVRPTRLRAS